MKAILIVCTGLLFLTACSTRKYSATVTDSTHVTKSRQQSDSTSVVKNDSVSRRIDTSVFTSKGFTFYSASKDSTITYKADSGSIIFYHGQPLALQGKGLSFTGSFGTSSQVSASKEQTYKKGISDLTETHKSDSLVISRLKTTLDSMTLKKAEVSLTVTPSSIWGYLVAGPVIAIAVVGIVAALAIYSLISLLIFIIKKLVNKKPPGSNLIMRFL